MRYSRARGFVFKLKILASSWPTLKCTGGNGNDGMARSNFGEMALGVMTLSKAGCFRHVADHCLLLCCVNMLRFTMLSVVIPNDVQ